jgi:hypothetical protein
VGRLEQVERQRATARDAMFSLKEETEHKLGEVQEGKRRKNLFLAKITDEKESYDHMVTELERSAGRVDSLLKDLLEQRTKLATAQVRQRGGKSHTLLGQFLWGGLLRLHEGGKERIRYPNKRSVQRQCPMCLGHNLIPQLE